MASLARLLVILRINGLGRSEIDVDAVASEPSMGYACRVDEQAGVLQRIARYRNKVGHSMSRSIWIGRPIRVVVSNARPKCGGSFDMSGERCGRLLSGPVASATPVDASVACGEALW